MTLKISLLKMIKSVYLNDIYNNLNDNKKIVIVCQSQKFAVNITNLLNEEFPDKLIKCYIYNAPFIFSQIITLVSKFIDKKTQNKIELIQ